VTSADPDEYTGQSAPNNDTFTYTDDKGKVRTIPNKVEYGWDYAPGASVSSQMQGFIDNKAASLPMELGTAFKADIDSPKNALPHISDALKLPKSGLARNATHAVLKEIDKLHSTVELPEIPVKNSTSYKFQGHYSYQIGGNPIAIAISTASNNPELTAAHEIGHFIDHQALWDIGSYASAKSPLLAKWREAVEVSTATNSLKTVLKTHDDYKTKKLAAYYLSAHEQWARSYAQWVATRSGNGVMIDQVKNIILHPNVAARVSQWDEADFKLIAEAIDEIFKSLGWLK
jgi:hypothetical protein